MAITKPPVLPAWADAGDKVQPSNAELSVGWPVSSTPPSRQRFNWALNFVANAVRYFSRRGLVDYDVAETYMIGDRVIGDDGKTYKCLVDNTIAFAPSTNPAKWARWGFTLAELNSEVTTPAQFDNATKVATTAFVQQALGSWRGVATSGGTTTLTVAAVGFLIDCNAAGTVTLPLGAALVNGACISFLSVVSGVTISRQGADLISMNGTPINSVALNAGDSLILVWFIGVGWMCLGGTAQTAYSSLFGASLASSGYQKLPSGLIIQWGTFTGSASADTPITFPISFPNLFLNAYISGQCSGTGAWGGFNTPTLAGMNGNWWSTNTVRQSGNANYFAIGK